VAAQPGLEDRRRPGFLAIEIAARDLGLRVQPSGHIRRPRGLATPDDGPCRGGYHPLTAPRHLSAWSIADLRKYDKVVLPQLTARQKQIVAFALKYIGFPYVWGGEYPSRNSPYGRQAHGGFDCSGFDWWVMKMHFDYTINERTAAGMAGAAKHRVTRAKLVPGDLIFFGPKGPKSTPGVDLPRGPLPGQRLVHPVDRLARRRGTIVAQHRHLLEGGLRLGPAGAHERSVHAAGSARRRLRKKKADVPGALGSGRKPPVLALVVAAPLARLDLLPPGAVVGIPGYGACQSLGEPHPRPPSPGRAPWRSRARSGDRGRAGR